jgi:hypothetical protein
MQYLRWTRLAPADTAPPIKYGEVVRADDPRLSQRIKERFIASGTLAPIQTPPLAELPDWEERAGLLAEAGVITISDLAEASDRSLARTTGKTPRIIRQWREEAERWLNPESQIDDPD